MNWITLINMFAGPIGSIINKALAAGAASFVAWQVSKGIPLTDASNIAGELVTLLSTVISSVAGTQGAKIASVNATNNGVKVVAASSSSVTVNAPLA